MKNLAQLALELQRSRQGYLVEGIKQHVANHRRKTMDAEFEAIIEKAIREAEKVKCSPEEFKEGLELMLENLQMRVEAAS